jgi:hypothetical protein
MEKAYSSETSESTHKSYTVLQLGNPHNNNHHCDATELVEDVWFWDLGLVANRP